MKKVLVIGCPGSGKSTFARYLHDVSELPLYYLDMIWHKEDKTTYTQEEFDVALDKILDKDAWIIDGNYSRTLDKRLDRADTVYFLDLDLDVCLSSIISRLNKKRPDMPWVEEEIDEEFMDFIRDFPISQRPKILEALNRHDHIKVITFKTRAEVNEYIKERRYG